MQNNPDMYEDTEKDSPKVNFLHLVLVDGKYTPSSTELIDLINKVDIKKTLENTKIVDGQSNNRLSLMFDSIEESHLFVLYLMAKMSEAELIRCSPSEDFFKENLLEDYRIDGGQLSYTETREDQKILASFFCKYPKDYEERSESFNNKIKELVRDVLPSSSDQINTLDLFSKGG